MDTGAREDFFADHTVSLLQEVADSIAQYLELVYVSLYHERDARFMEGLSLFAPGEPTREADQLLHHTFLPSPNGHAETTSESSQSEGTLSSRCGFSGARNQCESSDSTMSIEDTFSPFAASLEASDRGGLAEPESVGLDEASEHTSVPTRSSDFPLTFNRAASLIREAMGIDGLVFLDAPLDAS